MLDPTRKFATYEDVLSAPSDKVAEVIFGVLVLSPWPDLRQGHLLCQIAGELRPFDSGCRAPEPYVFLARPELHLGPHILVPEIAGYREMRLPVIGDEAYETIAPDWICEILSPSTARWDRGEKLDIYGAEGVKHAWLVDPADRSLEIFRNESGKWLRLGQHIGDVVIHPEPFDAVPFELGAIWANLA